MRRTTPPCGTPPRISAPPGKGAADRRQSCQKRDRAFRPDNWRFRRRSRTGLRQYQEGRQVLWRRYDRDGLDPIGQDSPHRPDGGGPQEVRTQGGGDAQGARARRIVDGARCERTFEFAIEVYAFRVAFVLLLTRRLARSV